MINKKSSIFNLRLEMVKLEVGIHIISPENNYGKLGLSSMRMSYPTGKMQCYYFFILCLCARDTCNVSLLISPELIQLKDIEQC
jgi:hypothetical protein